MFSLILSFYLNAAQQVQIDPQTGAFMAKTLPAQQKRADPHQGLKQMPLPRGGYYIDLQGRFMVPLKAQVQPDGSLRLYHEN